MLFMIDDACGWWQWYRQLRGGRWHYNPMWGWIRDERRATPTVSGS